MMKLISKRGRQQGRNGGVTLTADQVAEIKACTLDPVHFMNTYVNIPHNSLKGSLWLKLYDYQEDFIKALDQFSHVIGCFARQAGVSTLASAWMVWEALFNPKRTVILMGTDIHMAQMLCGLVNHIITYVPAWLRPRVVRATRSIIELENGSIIKITVCSTNAFRGLHADRIFIDNFAYAPAKVQHEVRQLLPSVMSRGCGIIITSTPNGYSNSYAKMWHDAVAVRNPYIPIKVTIDDMRQFDSHWKRLMKAAIGTSAWSRDFECEFT